VLIGRKSAGQYTELSREKQKAAHPNGPKDYKTDSNLNTTGAEDLLEFGITDLLATHLFEV
jgi:hypothetical protein